MEYQYTKFKEFVDFLKTSLPMVAKLSQDANGNGVVIPGNQITFEDDLPQAEHHPQDNVATTVKFKILQAENAEAINVKVGEYVYFSKDDNEEDYLKYNEDDQPRLYYVDTVTDETEVLRAGTTSATTLTHKIITVQNLFRNEADKFKADGDYYLYRMIEYRVNNVNTTINSSAIDIMAYTDSDFYFEIEENINVFTKSYKTLINDFKVNQQNYIDALFQIKITI